MSRFRNAWAAGYVALVGALLTLGPPAFAQGEKTIRAVMHAEVKWVDPHWTTANITQQHAYMIYETLFALDSKGNPRPQMVDTFRVSPDKLTYTFVLRNGLKWHDGQPVRAIDAVASLKRWAVKDAAGQKLMAKTRLARGGGRQDARPQAEGAIRPHAPRPRQGVQLRAVHHPRAAGRAAG